jgi:CHASE2 domain-containing sensor protein
MNYKNFDLSIERDLGDGYQVKVQSETMGEASGTFALPADWEKTLAALSQVQSIQNGNPLPMNLGVSLYQGLFRETIASVLNKSLGAVLIDDDAGLRFRLRLTPAEIAFLPWEVLYDGDSKCFVCTSGKTPLTRYLEIPEPIRNLKISPPVKVLALIPGGSGLDVENEERILTEALKKLGTVEITVLKDKVTRADISRALVDEQYHILHFIGHGTFEKEQGYLLINNEDDGHDLVSADIFADFFRGYPSLKLVVLNSCRGAEVSRTRKHTGMAQQLVARGIPAVVAMQYPVSDDAALVFAREFYLKLCSGWSRGQVDAAISHARNRIYMDIKDEPMAFATPVLFMRSTTGVVFDFHQKVSIVRGFLRLFTSYPINNVGRLQEVKRTYEQNREAWEKKSIEASPAERVEAVNALASEEREVRAVNLRIIMWLLAATAVFLYGYFGFFGGAPFHIDNWIEGKAMPVLDWGLSKQFSPDVKLILADHGKNGALGVPGPDWRQYHGALIGALTKAGAKVIVFDLELSTTTQHDQQFADAITQAEQQGTHVILAKGLEPDGKLLFGMSDPLQKATGDQWGNIIVGGVSGGFLRIYQLAQPASGDRTGPETALVPSLGLKAILTFFSQNTNVKAFYNRDVRQIQMRSDGELIKSIPVYQNSQRLYDFPFDLATTRELNQATSSYTSVWDQRENPDSLKEQFGGKIVLVGFREGDLFNVLWGEQRSGAELHANVISNILSDVYVRVPPWYVNLFMAVLMVALGVLVRTRFRHVFSTNLSLSFSRFKKTIDVPGLLIAADVAYLLVVFLLYRNQHLYILKSFHLAAPFLAYWVTGKISRRPKLKLASGVTQ